MAWKDSVSALKVADETSALKKRIAQQEATIGEQDDTLTSRQLMIAGLCILSIALAVALIVGGLVLMRYILLTRRQKNAIRIANENNALKAKFISNISTQLDPVLSKLKGNTEEVTALRDFSKHIQTMADLESSEEAAELEGTMLPQYCEALMDEIRSRVKKDVTLTVNAPKIIVPMTAKDTIAAYDDGRKGLYMDNANVWFVSVPNADETTMKAVAALINSTVFSVLAKVDANPQSGGYFKFNKQFLAPVPFPSSRLLSESRVRRKLASLHDEIRQLELRWCGENPNHRALTGLALNRKWRRLDDCCARLYGLTEGEIAAVGKVGRTIDRTQLLPQT